jgi:hypothetical protein
MPALHLRKLIAAVALLAASGHLATAQEASPVTVLVTEAQLRSIRPGFEHPAVVEALETAAVRPVVGGQIVERDVTPGDVVEERDLLFRIDDGSTASKDDLQPQHVRSAMGPQFFIRRPKFAFVISIVITLMGLLALQVMPIDQYPDIAAPKVVVRANYPGASADTVRDAIASPIEDQVNGAEGMVYMSSKSASDGSYTLTVTFEIGVDADLAQ